MPQVPLRRKLLQDLDDIDLSYKRARLALYLDDIHFPTPTDEEADTSDTSDTSISSSSSITSSSHSSGSNLSSSISLTPSEIMEEYLKGLEKEIQMLREKIFSLQYLRPRHAVAKKSQIQLLSTWRNGNVDQFRWKVRDHHIFHNNSNFPQVRDLFHVCHNISQIRTLRVASRIPSWLDCLVQSWILFL